MADDIHPHGVNGTVALRRRASSAVHQSGEQASDTETNRSSKGLLRGFWGSRHLVVLLEMALAAGIVSARYGGGRRFPHA
ncbi:MAG: hypothetical protein QOH09_1988 [Pseudonocardiales bacterium]|nr:hypothetical protein [Pseudonocardiales bacterium]